MEKYLGSALMFFALVNINVVSGMSDKFDPVNLSFLNIDFSAQVELKYLDESRIVSREEARQQLESLIKRINPTSIIRLHEGSSRDGLSNYGIIKLISNEGNYRIFYYCEKILGEYLIKRIRVNKL